MEIISHPHEPRTHTNRNKQVSLSVREISKLLRDVLVVTGLVGGGRARARVCV